MKSLLAVLILLFATTSAYAVTLRPGHPNEVTVTRGDTLWDISGRFLQHPWEWPQLWRANPQIKNPHLIYPGDRLSLKWVNGQPTLVHTRGKRSGSAIPTVDYRHLEKFLMRPYLLDKPTPDLYVLELSSFQLQRTRNLPAAVSVLLNVTPDHLDWHASEAEYRESKYRVFDQAAAAVVNRADEAAAKRAERCGRVVTFGLDAPDADQFGIREDEGEKYLACGDALLLSVRDLALYGIHNQMNALAALAAGTLLGLDRAGMLQVLVEFPGLPHRMQFVARISAVDYINDSKATNVAAAVASVNSVDGMLVLVAGGDGKGGDFSDLAEAVEGKLRGVVLIGKDAEKIAYALDTVMPVHFAENMESAVHMAASCAESDDTVLLAPACASLDQYDNYMARGDAFIAAVEGLRR